MSEKLSDERFESRPGHDNLAFFQLAEVMVVVSRAGLLGAILCLGVSTAYHATPALRTLRSPRLVAASWTGTGTASESAFLGSRMVATERKIRASSVTRPTMGLFGLGGPELVVILAVVAFVRIARIYSALRIHPRGLQCVTAAVCAAVQVMGPENLANTAKEFGKTTGEMKKIPEGFKQGYDAGATSTETGQVARELGQALGTVKETVVDMSGEYKNVATEFTAGVREGAKAVNQELVGGVWSPFSPSLSLSPWRRRPAHSPPLPPSLPHGMFD